MSVIVRVGMGYDLHRLELGARLVLGGLEIPYRMGLAGHSDADVVLHAVIDALLGAAGLPDIGEQFPDTDPAYEGTDSSKLLSAALEKVRKRGYVPVNVDVTIVAQSPKLSKYKPKMRKQLAKLLGLEKHAASVKAKTNEGLDAVGQAQAIACYAVVGLGNR